MTRGFRPATDDVRSLPKRSHRARQGAGGRALRGGLEYRYDTARHRPDRTRSVGGTGTAGPECAGGGDNAYHRHPQRQPAAPRGRQTHQIDAVDRGSANHERLDQIEVAAGGPRPQDRSPTTWRRYRSGSIPTGPFGSPATVTGGTPPAGEAAADTRRTPILTAR